MSIGDEAEAVLHQIVPQSRLASLLGRILPYLVIVALIGFLIWWVFVRPAQLVQDAEQAKVDTHVQAGTAKAATDALKIMVDVAGQHRAIDDITRSNQDAILSAAGASAPVDPAVLAALHSALCLRVAYQSERDCARVPPAGGSVGAAETDGGSRPAE